MHALLTFVGIPVAIFWVGGSSTILACRPWRLLDRKDRWLACALILGWPIIALWMAAELGNEWRLDRRDRLARHGR